MPRSKNKNNSSHKNNLAVHIQTKRIKDGINRAKGQLEGILRMLESENFDPEQVLTQLSAVSSAVSKLKIRFVQEYTKAKVLSSLEELSKML